MKIETENDFLFVISCFFIFLSNNTHLKERLMGRLAWIISGLSKMICSSLIANLNPDIIQFNELFFFFHFLFLSLLFPI